MPMEPIYTNQRIYSTWPNEIEISINHVPSNKVPVAVEATRQSLLDIAKAKTGQKSVTLEIAWQVEGKYFTETITG